MKTKLLIIILNLILSSLNKNILNTENLNDSTNIFNDIIHSIPYWENSIYSKCNSFYFNNFKYEVYEITKNNDFKGYFIANENNKIETFYIGEDRPDDYSNLSSLSPLFAPGDKTYKTQSDAIETTTLNYSFYTTPVVTTDLFQSYYNSNYSENIVTGCPTYFSPNDYFCAPTAATMLISFFDRYSNLTNLIDGLLPLEHEENNTSINQLINQFASLMETTEENGSFWPMQQLALNQYISSKGYQYSAYRLTDYLSYSAFNSSCRQPAQISIEFIDSDGDTINHSVLGIGVASVRNSGNYIVSHYGIRDKKLGNYYIPADYFVRAFYIGES